jgi:hypothetical protein
MRWGVLLPVLALVTGCASEAALTTSAPDATLSAVSATSGITPPPASPSSTATASLANPASAPPSSSSLAPVALSRAQTAAIEDAMWRVIEDPAWVRVGPVNAGIAPGGVTIVCGTVKSRNSFGVYSKTTPFRGEFRGKEFKTAAVNGQSAAAALAACEKAGLPINPQES